MLAQTQVSCLCVLSVSIWPFQLEFCSLFSLLFVCPLCFIFPFFSTSLLLMLCLSRLRFLFWLVSLFSRLRLSSFRFCFRSRGFAICLSRLMFRFTLLIFCFVWKLTLSFFNRQGQRRPQRQYHHRRMG